MTLAMADSIYAANLPAGFPAYLGYVDGAWPTAPALVARFPQAHILAMAVFASSDAEGCDCEKGDLTPGQVPGWVKRQMGRGVARPCVYASVANMPPILSALAAAGISRPQVRLLSAHYGLGPHICGPATCKYFPGMPAMDGTQWTDLYGGAHGSLIDASLLLDDFFGGPMSATGPASWDAADWTTFRQQILRGVLAHAGNDFTTGLSAGEAADVNAAHAGLAAVITTTISSLVPSVAQIAAGVLTALPPAAQGGLTQDQVQAAVEAGVGVAFARAFPPAAA